MAYSRVQITLPPAVLERLDALGEELGLRRSALVAMLINEKWKEVHQDEK